MKSPFEISEFKTHVFVHDADGWTCARFDKRKLGANAARNAAYAEVKKLQLQEIRENEMRERWRAETRKAERRGRDEAGANS